VNCENPSPRPSGSQLPNFRRVLLCSAAFIPTLVEAELLGAFVLLETGVCEFRWEFSVVFLFKPHTPFVGSFESKKT
jgi:hypothetical protein